MDEYLSLETAKKLTNYDKAIKYMKKVLNRDNICRQTEVYIENILNILEVKNESKSRSIFKITK